MDWESLLPDIAALIAIAFFSVGGYILGRAAAAWLRTRGAQPYVVRIARVTLTIIILALDSAVLFVVYGPLPIASGLTVSAIAALAVALALQTAIGNVIAGFILFNDRVLRLGDNVQISGIAGTVVRVGLVTTWLRLPDGSVASVSNSNLLSGPLVNRSAQDRLKGEY
jgi:small conductance mechanosensitive channel